MSVREITAEVDFYARWSTAEFVRMAWSADEGIDAANALARALNREGPTR